MSVQSLLNSARELRNKIYPPPRREKWTPSPVYVREVDGEYYYDDAKSEEVDKRCTLLGIIPNVYIVTDDFHPDRDEGTVGRDSEDGGAEDV